LGGNQDARVASAALKEAGVVGDSVGPETMKVAKNQVGQAFDDAIAATPKVELKPDFFNKAGQSIGTYTENVAASEIIPRVAKRLDDFFDPKLMKGGPSPELSGEQFQAFRSDISKSVNALYAGGKSAPAKALQGVREALDDAAAATLPADQVEAWNTARRNYANFKIIEKAAARGTAGSRSSGTLAPTALTQELRKAQGDRFSSTTGGLNDVATVSQYLADTFPNSGTPTIAAGQAMMAAPAISNGPILQTARELAALTGVPNLAARGMTGGGPVSDLIRSYLVNQALPSRLQSIGGASGAMTPSMLTDPRVQALLNDQRGGR
jgi:hypothetical protein